MNDYEDLFNARIVKSIAYSESKFTWNKDGCTSQVDDKTDGLEHCKTIVFGRSTAEDSTSYIDFATHFGFVSHEPLNFFALGFSPLLDYVNYIPKFITTVIYRSSGAFSFPHDAEVIPTIDKFLADCSTTFAFSCVEVYFVACKSKVKFLIVRDEKASFKDSTSLPTFVEYDRKAPVPFCEKNAVAPWGADLIYKYHSGALSWISTFPSTILPELFVTENDKKRETGFTDLVKENKLVLDGIASWDDDCKPIAKSVLIQQSTKANKIWTRVKKK